MRGELELELRQAHRRLVLGGRQRTLFGGATADVVWAMIPPPL